MALSTYGELKTSVAAWMDRTDLTSVIVDCVTLTEADIRNDVRCQAMEQVATGTLSGETLAHPTRFLEAKAVYIANKEYQFLTPHEYLLLGSTSEKYVYTSIGQSFYFKGTSVGDYTIVYWQSFAAFSADSDTNWLLTNYPDIYLSGACRHAANYLKSFEDENRMAQRYAGGVGRLTTAQQRAAHPGHLQVRAW